MKLPEKIKNSKWFKITGNIYVLISTIFVIWMLFFDSNSLLNHLELKREINKLKKQKEHLESEIAKDKQTIKNLKNEEGLEKFAREKYYLKKENEEIYIIEYEDSLKTGTNE
ncbi:FtsB family cell division protein [Abyssalbus ytuae]|uniref:Septum formation initiator family protein n=1 Tax=Abyssalbus ytuae TaxID=2926907 RepID=A0A9E6ZQI1_9FLAO|nr:septum formation initiator family protein [Abyssalbus ytuae]UOB16923.1 septum formation initiator family protein [Abyssalbus ytuae]